MKWIICFHESKNIGIWKLFTRHRPKFGHVFAVYYDVKLDAWSKIEYTTRGFNLMWFRGEDADFLIYDLVKNCICIEVEENKNPTFLPRWLYCVSFIKHVCGISKPWILTPYQLYCELRNSGGKAIFIDN
jgi:hypothetical protein|tara:strand:+ start:159 stop:548 length:390 start_codon:yes stop_codon:yes gene_type:complete